MQPGGEVLEAQQRMSGVMGSLIQASTQLAVVLIELRIELLRRAAREQQDRTRQVQAQMRAHHQADAAVWRAAMRPQWWRSAGAEDIARVWRAASTWQHVDPRAAEARRVVADELERRGVRIDERVGAWPSPDDVVWLSEALDTAAVQAQAGTGERGEQPAPQPERRAPGEVPQRDPERDDRTVAAERAVAAAERAAKMERAAEHVRAVWSAERAERVLGCRAWGALEYQLGQLEDQGHDVENLLRGVPNFVDHAHTPAAFAFRSIEERLEDLDTAAKAFAQRVQSAEQDASAGRSSGASRARGEQSRAPGMPPASTRGAGEVPATGPATALYSQKLETAHVATLAAQAYPGSTRQALAQATTTVVQGEAMPQHTRPVVAQREQRNEGESSLR